MNSQAKGRCQWSNKRHTQIGQSIRHSPFAIRHSPFAIRHSPFAPRQRGSLPDFTTVRIVFTGNPAQKNR